MGCRKRLSLEKNDFFSQPYGINDLLLPVDSGFITEFKQKYLPTLINLPEKTELELVVVPGIVKCRDCGRVFNAAANDLHCPHCGGQDLEILGGNDMIIREIVCR